MTWTTLQRSELAPGLAGFRSGDGPSMLLVHGVGMCADFWAAVIPDLEPRFAVTAVDLPGHGHSAAIGDQSVALSSYSDALIRIMERGSEPWIVVGHSLGALLALDLTVRRQDLVSGVGVLNGVYRRTAEAARAVRARAAELSLSCRPDNGTTLQRWFGDEPSGVESAAASACCEWLDTVDPAGYRDAYQVFADSDAPTDDALRSISARALVMTGSLEPNSTPAMAHNMTRLIPGAECVVVDAARHMMPLTHSTDTSNAILGRFAKSDAQ